MNKGGAEIHAIVLGNLSREARLMTDEHTMYKKIGREFAEHSRCITTTKSMCAAT